MRDCSDRKGVKYFKVVKGVKRYKVERFIEFNCLRCWILTSQGSVEDLAKNFNKFKGFKEVKGA